jgi:hypothetical protein
VIPKCLPSKVVLQNLHLPLTSTINSTAQTNVMFPDITTCSVVAKLPITISKKNKTVVPIRSSPCGNNYNPNIIGPNSSPTGKSTRAAALDFFKKQPRPQAKAKNKQPSKRNKKITTMTDPETQAAIAASLANTRTITALGQEKIKK